MRTAGRAWAACGACLAGIVSMVHLNISTPAAPLPPARPAGFPQPSGSPCLAAACLFFQGLPRNLEERELRAECGKHSKVSCSCWGTAIGVCCIEGWQGGWRLGGGAGAAGPVRQELQCWLQQQQQQQQQQCFAEACASGTLKA